MRISVDSNDPGNENFQRMGLAKVFLDGKEIDRVMTADEEEGYIVRLKLNGMGIPEIDPETQLFALETLYGGVIIEPIPIQPPSGIGIVHDDAADHSTI